MTDNDETTAEALAFSVAIAESDADPRIVPHEDVRVWLSSLAAGDFEATPPEPR